MGSHGREGMMWAVSLPTHSCQGCGLCQKVIDPYLLGGVSHRGTAGGLLQPHTGSSHTRLNATTRRIELVFFLISLINAMLED